MDISRQVNLALHANEKNISDLISQDITMILFANYLLDNPEMESQIKGIFHHIYLNTCRTIEDLLYAFLNSQSYNFDFDEQQIKQEIQLFVDELVFKKEAELYDKMDWLQRFR